MKIIVFAFAIFTFSTTISQAVGSAEDGSFFEVDADFKRLHRNLLQYDDEEDTEEPVGVDTSDDSLEEAEKQKETGLFVPGEDQLGPKLFYTTDFLLEVDTNDDNEGITIVKEDGSAAFLNAKAVSIQGSYVVPDEVYEVAIDWKNKEFGNGIGGVQINMQFRKNRTEFTLIEMEVSSITIDGSRRSFELKVTAGYDYKVKAPRGLAFACDSPGLFEAKQSGLKGITFPGMKLQVFFEETTNLRNFGPLWYCGELMPIGLWVGLIVTIFYAFVCYWGFSMLASINTMDRFDDPKGKQIYVPQTE